MIKRLEMRAVEDEKAHGGVGQVGATFRRPGLTPETTEGVRWVPARKCLGGIAGVVLSGMLLGACDQHGTRAPERQDFDCPKLRIEFGERRELLDDVYSLKEAVIVITEDRQFVFDGTYEVSGQEEDAKIGFVGTVIDKHEDLYKVKFHEPLGERWIQIVKLGDSRYQVNFMINWDLYIEAIS